MKFNFKVVSVAFASIALALSCTKEKANEDAPVYKVRKHTIRDFTKGVMTIEYTDGTKSIEKIPIDSTPFVTQESLSSGRIEGETSVEATFPEAPIPTPEYPIGKYPGIIYYREDEKDGIGPQV
ncbi:hypothetical protein [Chitinophaga polysaccharea]|uniref:hypothetical protein n=1 Tax=Chitinophaga polysaccharea TaxID=1293035 RepID=UPI001156DC74|nr:hypothetical protein [Chitinophaga polysaccharea]